MAPGDHRLEYRLHPLWQEFEDLFPTQGWVKQRLDELERSRNIIAHGNLLSESEVQRIEQYLDDWLRQVP